MKLCLTEQDFTREVIEKLRNFSIMQAELAQELQAAKPLGISKITTYVDPKSGFKNLDLTYKSGKSTTRTVTILTKDGLKEILS